MSLVSVSAQSGVPLLLDRFTDTDGTSLDLHRADVGGVCWTENQGDFEIASNRARAVAAASQQIATAECRRADVTLTCDLIPAASGSPGVVLRYTNTLNFWYLRASEAGNTFALVEVNAGVFTTRATTAVAIVAGVTYALRVVTSGTTITATLDGGSQITWPSAALNSTVTRHGITDADAAASSIDNFLVTA